MYVKCMCIQIGHLDLTVADVEAGEGGGGAKAGEAGRAGQGEALSLASLHQ